MIERFSEGVDCVLGRPCVQTSNTDTSLTGSYWHAARVEVGYRGCRGVGVGWKQSEVGLQSAADVYRHGLPGDSPTAIANFAHSQLRFAGSVGKFCTGSEPMFLQQHP